MTDDYQTSNSPGTPAPVEQVLLVGGVLQVLGVMVLYVLDRPALAPARIDLAWHTVALIQSALLFGAIVWGIVLQQQMQVIRTRLDELDSDRGQVSGGVPADK